MPDVNLRWIALTILAALAAGCATAYQAVPVVADLAQPIPAGSTRVCVARPDPFEGRDRVTVRDDGRVVGTIVGGSFLCWDRPAGDFELTAEAENTVRLRLTGTATRICHVELIPRLGALRVRCQLATRSPDQAAGYLPRCRAAVFQPLPATSP